MQALHHPRSQPRLLRTGRIAGSHHGVMTRGDPPLGSLTPGRHEQESVGEGGKLLVGGVILPERRAGPPPGAPEHDLATPPLSVWAGPDPRSCLLRSGPLAHCWARPFSSPPGSPVLIVAPA